MPLRMLSFLVLCFGAVALGRATRLEGTQLALVWPAAGIAFLWLAAAWRAPRWRAVALLLLFAATAGGNLVTGAAPSLALAFGIANSVQAWVSCAVFARLRPGGWRMHDQQDVRALLAGALAGACAGAVIGPV